MKLLHTVEFYEPSKGGAQEVIKQLSERLAQRGHSVTVATSRHPARTPGRINGVEVREFNVRGNAVKGISGSVGQYEEYVCDSDFDLIFNYAAQTWTTDVVFSHLDRIKAGKVIAPLGYSRLHDQHYTEYFRALPQYLAKYDWIAYTSAHYQDKDYGDAHGLGGKAVTIPNGASLEEFSQTSREFKKRYNIDTRYLFLSVSNHYFAKGHLFVLEAFRKLRNTDCTLVLIGERPYRHRWYSCYPLCSLIKKIDRRVVLLRGIPRADVVAAFQEADLFLFGSKVECAPLVMYESFASRTPFITTAVGNVRDHQEFLRIVNTPEQLYSEMVEFHCAPDSYRSMAEKAYQLFREHHSWEHIAQQYEQLFLEVVAEGSSGR